MTAMDQALKAYNLESSDLKIEKIHNGLINSTWYIKNSHRSYILQKVITVKKAPVETRAILLDYEKNVKFQAGIFIIVYLGGLKI